MTASPSAGAEDGACPTAAGLQAVCASTGAAGVSGTLDQTTIGNTQVAAATTGGGPALVTAQNTSNASLHQTGSATGQSGVSVARTVPTTTTGGPAVSGTGSTSATSGAAQANGATAQNTIATSAIGVAQVGGTNSAPVTVQASNSVSVQDTGTANATSGNALAQPAAADAKPGAGADPSGGQGASAQASQTAPASGQSAPGVASQANAAGGQGAPGLASQTTLDGATDSTTVASGAQGAGPVDVTHTQHVEVASVGAGSAASGPTTAGASPVPADGTTVTAASTGAAQAQGVLAQNTVTQNATASVQVRGQNFAPIQIIIDSITRIINTGSANATSGSASATGTQLAGSPAAPGTGSGARGANPSATGGNASSANASATGANVVNHASLSSSAFVHITGDNFNPVNVLLSLFVGLTNTGSATASTGSTTGGASAHSGAANAIGLQAVNEIEMQARAGVLVDGSNYAPINVRLELEADIVNTGQAVATSGNSVAVSHPATSVSGASGASGGASPGRPSATPSPTPRALPLPQTRLQTAAQVNAPLGPRDSSSIVLRSQVAVANGSSGTSTSTGTGTSTSTSTATSTSTSGLAPAALAGAPLGPGAYAWSGDASCLGSASDSRVGNTQLSAVANPGGPSRATNSLSHTVSSDGDVTCGAGFAGVNATPTPVPTPRPASADHGLGTLNAANQPALAPTATPITSTAQVTGLRYGRVASHLPAGELVNVAWQHAYPPFEPPSMPMQRTRARGSTQTGGPSTAAARAEPLTSDLPVPNQATRHPITAAIQPDQVLPAQPGARASVRVLIQNAPAASADDQAPAPEPAASGAERVSGPAVSWDQDDPPGMPPMHVPEHGSAGANDTATVAATDSDNDSTSGESGDALAAALAVLGGAVAAGLARRRGLSRGRTWLARLRPGALSAYVNHLSGRTVR